MWVEIVRKTMQKKYLHSNLKAKYDKNHSSLCCRVIITEETISGIQVTNNM